MSRKLSYEWKIIGKLKLNITHAFTRMDLYLYTKGIPKQDEAFLDIAVKICG